jgi:deazaflavin-dependent oxidoreductase (nitroreductase family)
MRAGDTVLAMSDAPLTAADKLARIDALDAGESSGLLRRTLLRIGPKPWFVAWYRRVGPLIDPTISRIRDGRLMHSIYGLPGMVLHTTGAKSGLARSNPLLYARDGRDFIVVGTNFGQPKHPAWTANLLAHPEAGVEAAGVVLPVTAHLIEGEEWDEVFARLVAVYPGYALYLERRGDLPPRLFRLVPES